MRASPRGPWSIPPATVSENPRGRDSTPKFRTAGRDGDGDGEDGAVDCRRIAVFPARVSTPEEPTCPHKHTHQAFPFAKSEVKATAATRRHEKHATRARGWVGGGWPATRRDCLAIGLGSKGAGDDSSLDTRSKIRMVVNRAWARSILDASAIHLRSGIISMFHAKRYVEFSYISRYHFTV